MQMTSVNCENSPSMSLILANMHDSKKSHIFTEIIHITNGTWTLHFWLQIFLFLTKSLQEGTMNPHKPYPFLNQALIQTAIPFLLYWQNCVLNRQIFFRSGKATGIAGAGSHYCYVHINSLRSVCEGIKSNCEEKNSNRKMHKENQKLFRKGTKAVCFRFQSQKSAWIYRVDYENLCLWNLFRQ